MRFIRGSVKTTGLQIKPQGYITFVAWAAPLIRPLTITQHAVIDIGTTVFTSEMSYVALSRIQNITGLAIQNLETKKN